MAQTSRVRTRDDPAVRRAQILKETIRLIGERGYYGFPIQEVAKRCGITNAGLLHYFSSKDQLLTAVLQEYERHEVDILAPLIELATRRIGRTEKSRIAAAELLRRLAVDGTSQPEMMRLYSVLQAESLDPNHPAHQSFRARETKIIALLSEVVRPYCKDAASTARHVYAVMDGLGQQWIRSSQSFDLVTELERAVGRILPALAAPASKRNTPAKKK